MSFTQIHLKKELIVLTCYLQTYDEKSWLNILITRRYPLFPLLAQSYQTAHGKIGSEVLALILN